MANGKNAEMKGHHREYWSRRPGPKDAGWGRTYKDITHRLERRAAFHEERRALDGTIE